MNNIIPRKAVDKRGVGGGSIIGASLVSELHFITTVHDVDLTDVSWKMALLFISYV